MNRIDVALGARSYPVWIGNGLLDRAAELIGRPGQRFFLVTDRNVAAAGLAVRASRALQPIGLHLLEPGEQNKDMRSFEALLDALLGAGLGRGDCIAALGGGMTGDMAGFAAAVLKRGCDYVQIPTSLLAQVDAAVGGKTGINSRFGKNMIGAFHQPQAVLVDPQLLATLPERELRAGYAEVVKYGLIGDAAFYGWCEGHGSALLAGDGEARLHAIHASLAAKAQVVAEDETDRGGRRALLNFGHSFAHALEAETGFSDRLLHGEAVAIGMVLAFRFSAARGLCDPWEVERVAAHLASTGLPTSLAEANVAGASLIPHMLQDKKRSGEGLTLILTRGIGRAFVQSGVELDVLRGFLAEGR